MSEAERLRASYEGILKNNPSNVEGVHYLAIWHLERQSFQQAKKYFSHLASLMSSDPQVWLSLGVCCAMADELKDCQDALTKASMLIPNISQDSRIHFCHGLLFERQKDYINALDRYNYCINICNVNEHKKKKIGGNQPLSDEDASSGNSNDDKETPGETATGIFSDLKGDAMLRIAIVHKETKAYDLAMQDCSQISQEGFSLTIRANALCLKGLLHELRLEYPASEVVYRSALQLLPGHTLALERLGRVYLRYRETIPAAVQCFIKSVEVDPSGHIAWYLLGRCYMATAQYSDAWEAYNRATNLNPNDPQVWCSLGVLYYSFGQYREALGMFSRAIKLDPSMSDAWYNIGALYDMCDQPEDAQKAYVKAKETGLAERFARSGINVNNPVVTVPAPVSSSNTDNDDNIPSNQAVDDGMVILHETEKHNDGRQRQSLMTDVTDANDVNTTSHTVNNKNSNNEVVRSITNNNHDDSLDSDDAQQQHQKRQKNEVEEQNDNAYNSAEDDDDEEDNEDEDEDEEDNEEQEDEEEEEDMNDDEGEKDLQHEEK